MTQDRVDLLDKLGFSWEVRPGLERPRANWQQRLDELREFHTTHQHFKVPPETRPQLRSWSQEQKKRLELIDRSGKDTSKRMGPERVAALAELGFTKDVELGAPASASAANAQMGLEIHASTKDQDGDAPKVDHELSSKEDGNAKDVNTGESKDPVGTKATAGGDTGDSAQPAKETLAEV